jgi:hypothetical protein
VDEADELLRITLRVELADAELDSAEGKLEKAREKISKLVDDFATLNWPTSRI